MRRSRYSTLLPPAALHKSQLPAIAGRQSDWRKMPTACAGNRPVGEDRLGAANSKNRPP